MRRLSTPPAPAGRLAALAALALLAGCGGKASKLSGAAPREERPWGSVLKALATGQFEGASIPEPAAEVTSAEVEPIPSAPERRPVRNPGEARARALEDLASDSGHLRFVAAREAGWLRIQEAVPLLAKLAVGEDVARLPAIAALGRIGGERSARALAKAIGRAGGGRQRLAVIRALGTTRARSAVRPLERELLGDKTIFQIEAAAALGALGMRQGVSALREALDRTDFMPGARVAAAAALARLGDPAGVAALDRAATEPSPAFQALALRGMAALAGGSAPRGGVEAASLRAHAVRSLASAVGSQYDEVWSEAMKILARTRPQGAVTVLDALERRGSPEVALRARVARAAWGGPEAKEALERALQNPSHRLRAAACGIMGSLGDASSTEHLARALSDPSEAVRVSAAWALWSVGGREATRALERASAAEDVPLRNAARRALAALRARDGERARGSRSHGARPVRSSSRNDGTAEARKQASTGRLVLEQILVGADGKLFCMIRAPGSERRLVKRGEAVVFPGGISPGTGYRVEVIVPDGRGGGRVVLSRNEGKETLELTLEGGSSGGRRRREPTPPKRPLRLPRPPQ